MGYQCQSHLTTERNIAPDWVIEVLSPVIRERDLETKRKRYTGAAWYTGHSIQRTTPLLPGMTSA